MMGRELDIPQWNRKELMLLPTKFSVPTQRHAKHPIRTGCLSCRAATVKCDGTNPGCGKALVSEGWRLNNDVSWQWTGTWRERRGIHAFVNLAYSAKIVGVFESAFWHRTVLPACSHVPTLYHLASGIGALYETAIQHATGYGTTDKGRDFFALQQCNRAIGLLVKARTSPMSAEVALIASVLFTCFSGLQGEYETAGRHTRQGRKVLDLVARLEACGKTSGLARSESVRVVLDNLEVQAKILQGRNMQITNKERNPPLPDVSVLYSLEHAHWTLNHTYNRLWIFCQDFPLGPDAEAIAHSQLEKVATYAPWYKQWSLSLSTLLQQMKAEKQHLSNDDQKRLELLQLNCIHGKMMVSVQRDGKRSEYEPFDEEFCAIVDLSASVLRTFNFTVQTRPGKARYPYLNFGLWIDEPLFWTMSRCANAGIRKRAADLLLSRKYSNITNRKMIIKTAKLEDEWSADDWIKFAEKTRLDHAMARFFGGFPADFLEAPGQCDIYS